MNSALWYQRSNINGRDGFVIDGIRQDAENTSQQNEAISIIVNARQWKSSTYLPFLLKQTPKASKQLEIYLGENHSVMIQSHFTNRDDKGRLIPYMFYCHNDKNAVKVLRSFSEMAHLSINDNDGIIIEKVLLSRRRKPLYITLGVILVLGIIKLVV